MCAGIDTLALRFARINARHNDVAAETCEGAGIKPVAERPDIVIANPPFILDSSGRACRDGGEPRGAALSLDWALAAASRLAPGGRMLFYTGSAIVNGNGWLADMLARQLPGFGCSPH